MPFDQWISAAKIELNGKSPIPHLNRRWEGIDIQPYYDRSDVRSNRNHILDKTTLPFLGPNGWLNLPLVDGVLGRANELAHGHLKNGADGIIFKLTKDVSAPALLKGIKPEFCFLGFETNDNLLSFFEEAVVTMAPSDKIYGSILWKNEPEWLKVANLFKNYSNFRCFGIHLDGDDLIGQILCALQKVLKIADVLSDFGFSPQRILEKTAFSLEATNNFFLDIAKVRSLKILFERIGQAYSIAPTPAFVRMVLSPMPPGQDYEPHGNMLSHSFSALGAVVSSSDAITVITEDQNSPVHLHTARSVSLLLKEESKLDKVIDPLAGSYFVESLTSSIVEKVWTKLTAEK